MTSLDSFPCAHRQRAPLADRSTLRVGGTARLLLEPADPEQLVDAVRWVRERGERLHLLGGGANTILPDGEIDGVVVTTDRLRRTFRYIAPGDRADRSEDPFEEATPRVMLPEDGGEPVLVSWAGSSMPGIVTAAKGLGWSGVEGLAGVPGTIGGGVAMNAGGSWGDLWDVVELVRVLTPDGDVKDLERSACAPSYRNGNLGGAIVLAVVLRLRRSNKKAVADAVAEYLRHKRDVQPVTEASAGCVFKNPDKNVSGGRSAGRLVEEAGLKGASIGGAMVSPKHGNFVVNTGGATAADVLALIERMRGEVAERFGVVLEREVKVWETDPGA
ncbi:MAG: UDP-N-acetylmuramate dehydrogenase [Planctomycetota bacterium]